MTAPTKITYGTSDWWVLQSLRSFGAMPMAELLSLGTHETPEALKRVRHMNMAAQNHDKLIEITPKGRKALLAANALPKPSKIGPTPPRTTVNAGQREAYTAPELAPFDGRPGAMDAMSLPSLIAGVRRWRDGRVEVA